MIKNFSLYVFGLCTAVYIGLLVFTAIPAKETIPQPVEVQRPMPEVITFQGLQFFKYPTNKICRDNDVVGSFIKEGFKIAFIGNNGKDAVILLVSQLKNNFVVLTATLLDNGNLMSCLIISGVTGPPV